MRPTILTIGKRKYPVPELSLRTISRIVEALGRTQPGKFKHIPENTDSFAETLALAIAGDNCLAPLRAFVLKRRFLRESTFEQMLLALTRIIQAIPAEEFYGLCDLFSQFNQLTAKPNE